MPDAPNSGPDSPDPTSLLSLRSAVVFALSMLVGIGAGLLTAQAGTHPAAAVVYGAGALAAAACFFNGVIAR